MNKKILMFFALFLVCLTLFYAAPSKAIMLPVPVVGQNTTSWCTFGATQAVENYYGYYRAQYLDADWAQQTLISAGIWHAPYVECQQFVSSGVVPDSPDGWKCFSPMYGQIPTGTGSTTDIMTRVYGTGNVYVASPLASATAVQTEINAGHPFIMGVGNVPGGSSGHTIVAYGVSGYGVDGEPPTFDGTMPSNPTWSNTFIAVMDPDGAGPTSGAKVVYRGSTFFESGWPSWIDTIKTTTPVYIPIVSIMVNGTARGRTIYWNHTSPISVTANVTQGGFGGTQADWWVAALYHGVLYYYNASNGGWYTPAVPTWQKPLANYTTPAFWTTPIPAGDQITFYWITDLAQNGSLDYPMYSTYLTIIGT